MIVELLLINKHQSLASIYSIDQSLEPIKKPSFDICRRKITDRPLSDLYRPSFIISISTVIFYCSLREFPPWKVSLWHFAWGCCHVIPIWHSAISETGALYLDWFRAVFLSLCQTYLPATLPALMRYVSVTTILISEKQKKIKRGSKFLRRKKALIIFTVSCCYG